MTENASDIGPADFRISGNTIDNMVASQMDNGLETSAALFIGGYPDLGNHTVQFNNFEDGRVDRCCGNASYDVLDARNNWWGDPSGPGGPGGDDDPVGSGPGSGTDFAKDPKEGTLADGSGSPIVPRDPAKVRFDPWEKGGPF